MNPYRLEKIENWVSDFCQSDRCATLPADLREHAPRLLMAFLQGACEKRGIDIAEIVEGDLASGIEQLALRRPAPQPVLERFPELGAAFFDLMELQGRVAGAESLGLHLRAQRQRLTAPQPVKRPGSKVNRNDPCPCGSGLKYKKCCLRLLEGGN